MTHIVLAGDSIFDNGPYVDEPDAVIKQITRRLSDGTKATLLARDGDVTEQVADQLSQLPKDTTHLFVSCGGNDALKEIGQLMEPVTDAGEAFDLFSEIRRSFQQRYIRMLFSCKQKVSNLTVCTVYDSVPEIEEREFTALALFNEIILRESFQLGIPVIDLRLLCNEPSDYSTISSIEPSKEGANKIVNQILRVVDKHKFNSEQSMIYY
ncbi:MAG: SGNH/GDSL hydrolase family protein [Hahellaceae bacterium]|nr:SGNH/GDSL hydrolase family protein [Hahellaceae bacterium]